MTTLSNECLLKGWSNRPCLLPIFDAFFFSLSSHCLLSWTNGTNERRGQGTVSGRQILDACGNFSSSCHRLLPAAFSVHAVHDLFNVKHGH